MPNGTPNQLANLRPPWQKGQSGNSQRNGGRRKGQLSVVNELLRALEKRRICGMDIPDGMDAIEFLAESIIYHAIKGDATQVRTIIERVDGPVPKAEEPKEENTLLDAALDEAETVNGSFKETGADTETTEGLHG